MLADLVASLLHLVGGLLPRVGSLIG